MISSKDRENLAKQINLDFYNIPKKHHRNIESLIAQDEQLIVKQFIAPVLGSVDLEKLHPFRDSVLESLERAIPYFCSLLSYAESNGITAANSTFFISDGDRHDHGQRPIFVVENEKPTYIVKPRSADTDLMAIKIFNTLERPFSESWVVKSDEHFSIHKVLEQQPVVNSRVFSENLGYRLTVFSVLQSSDLMAENVFLLKDDLIPIDTEFLLHIPVNQSNVIPFSIYDFNRSGMYENLRISFDGQIIGSNFLAEKGIKDLDSECFYNGVQYAIQDLQKKSNELITLIKSVNPFVLRYRHLNTVHYYKSISEKIIKKVIFKSSEKILFEVPSYTVNIDLTTDNLFNQSLSISPRENVIHRISDCGNFEKFKPVSLADLDAVDKVIAALDLISVNSIFAFKMTIESRIDAYGGILGQIFFINQYLLSKFSILDARNRQLKKIYIESLNLKLKSRISYPYLGLDMYFMPHCFNVDEMSEIANILSQHIFEQLDLLKTNDLIGGGLGFYLGLKNMSSYGSNLQLAHEMARMNLLNQTKPFSQETGQAHSKFGLIKHMNADVIKNTELLGAGDESISWCRGRVGAQSKCPQFDISKLSKKSQCVCCGVSSLLMYDEYSEAHMSVIKDLEDSLFHQSKLRLHNPEQNVCTLFKGVFGINYAAASRKNALINFLEFK